MCIMINCVKLDLIWNCNVFFFYLIFDLYLVFFVCKMYKCYEDVLLLWFFFFNVIEIFMLVNWMIIKKWSNIKMYIIVYVYRNLIVWSVMGEDDMSVGFVFVILGGLERGVIVMRGGLW